MSDPNIRVLRKETYLRMIGNAAGTRMFNSIVVEYQDSKEQADITHDGELSCAVFVSSILTLQGLLDRPCATVKTITLKLKGSDYKEISGEILPGDIVIWEKLVFPNGTENEHVGFATGEGEAMSCSSKERQVVKHHLTYGVDEAGKPKRSITAVYRPIFNV